jgi:hypothetical protein
MEKFNPSKIIQRSPDDQGSTGTKKIETASQYQLTTIDDFKKNAGISKSELRLKFEQKTGEKINIDSVSENLINESKSKEEINKGIDAEGNEIEVKIYRDQIIAADSTEHSSIAIRDLEVDEYEGEYGASKKVAVYLIDRDNNKIINGGELVTYRDGKGRDKDKWEINYDEAKIISEGDSDILVGLRSRKNLVIKSFDKKTGTETELEKIDLDAEEKEQKKLDSVTNAFEKLDKGAMSKVVESMYERNITSNLDQISDSLELIGVSSYGEKDKREAELLLAIKDMGIIKLGKIEFDRVSKGISRDDYTVIELGDLSVKYLENSFVVTGKVKKRLDHFNGMGSTMKDIEEKVFEFEINNELDKTAPIKRDLENLKSKVLNHGNLNKISIAKLNFRDRNAERMLSNYPYDIQKITRSDGKELLVVSNVIDMEHLNGGYSEGYMAMEPQISFSVYEVDKLGSGNPTLLEKSSTTTDSSDRKEYALPVKYNRENGEVNLKKPEVSIDGDELSISVDVAVMNKENKNRLDLTKRTFKLNLESKS